MLDAACETAYRARRVLVTGGAGFIGSHLATRLVSLGANVSVIDNLRTGFESNLACVRSSIEFLEMDLLAQDIEALLRSRAFAYVFHLAGSANVTGSVEDPVGDFECNAGTTIRLLAAMARTKLEAKLVLCSSTLVYKERGDRALVETDALGPISPYAVAKLVAEQYVRLYASSFGQRASIVRLCSVFGPRLRKQIVYDILCKLHEDSGVLLLYGDGTQIRDQMHVRDAVDALLVVGARAAFDGSAYNVGSGRPITTLEIARAVCKELGVDPRIRFSGAVRRGENDAIYPDCEALHALGYRPGIGFAAGLSDTVAWFKAEEAPRMRS